MFSAIPQFLKPQLIEVRKRNSSECNSLLQHQKRWRNADQSAVAIGDQEAKPPEH
jgi:hypothetical protein